VLRHDDGKPRVSSDAGFSIVVPEHWESIKFDAEGGMISAYPRSVIPRRYSASISAHSIGPNPPKDLADFRPVQF
jgi:hypothetical protein